MSRQNPSIFNDILGPIMVGPSSSHTCGPARIGWLCRQLVKGGLVKADITFAKFGAYTNMYRGQRSDMGFTGGLLGYRPEDVRIRSAFAEADRQGVEIQFLIQDFPPRFPNHSILTLWGREGNPVVVHADSTGGGTLRLLEIDGLEVAIFGDCYEVLLFCKADKTDSLAKKVEELLPINEGISFSVADTRGLVNLKLREKPSSDLLSSLQSFGKCERLMQMEPVINVLSNRHGQIPFSNGRQVLKAAEQQGESLSELGVKYEMARSGWTRDEVLAQMDIVMDIIETGAKAAVSGKVEKCGVLAPTSAAVASSERGLNIGVLNTAIPWAMGVMEYNSDMGVVVCAPTGGAAGVIPGAVLGTAVQMGLSKEKKRDAMFAVGITGIVMAQDCNFSAELYGCQIEPGAASAMAAAGLVAMQEGTPKQAFDAAATAIHNILGIICDPVAGLVELPCISRNAMCTANAVVCANMALGGYDPLIGLDESTETLFRVGGDIPTHLRCTGIGGLCATKTAYRLAEEQGKRNNNR